MTNTNAPIEIATVQATESIIGTVLIIKEQPANLSASNLINQPSFENCIYDACIVYEF